MLRMVKGIQVSLATRAARVSCNTGSIACCTLGKETSMDFCWTSAVEKRPIFQIICCFLKCRYGQPISDNQYYFFPNFWLITTPRKRKCKKIAGQFRHRAKCRLGKRKQEVWVILTSISSGGWVSTSSSPTWVRQLPRAKSLPNLTFVHLLFFLRFLVDLLIDLQKDLQWFDVDLMSTSEFRHNKKPPVCSPGVPGPKEQAEPPSHLFGDLGRAGGNGENGTGHPNMEENHGKTPLFDRKSFQEMMMFNTFIFVVKNVWYPELHITVRLRATSHPPSLAWCGSGPGGWGWMDRDGWTPTQMKWICLRSLALFSTINKPSFWDDFWLFPYNLKPYPYNLKKPDFRCFDVPNFAACLDGQKDLPGCFCPGPAELQRPSAILVLKTGYDWRWMNNLWK